MHQEFKEDEFLLDDPEIESSEPDEEAEDEEVETPVAVPDEEEEI